MKKIFIASAFFVTLWASAQVGINTQTPRDHLDVMGKLLLDSYLILEKTQDVSGNFYLLARSNESTPVGELKKLDVDLRNVGPVNKYTAVISDVNDASIITLNTNLDASKYYLGLAEAYFDTAVKNVSLQGSDNVPVHGTYKTAVGKSNGKYTISLNFNGAGTRNNTNGTWTVSFVVFEKVLVRDWGTVTNQSVSGTATPSYSGASTATPLGLQ